MKDQLTMASLGPTAEAKTRQRPGLDSYGNFLRLLRDRNKTLSISNTRDVRMVTHRSHSAMMKRAESYGYRDI
jgi:hypothetical protein